MLHQQYVVLPSFPRSTSTTGGIATSANGGSWRSRRRPCQRRGCSFAAGDGGGGAAAAVAAGFAIAGAGGGGIAVVVVVVVVVVVAVVAVVAGVAAVW